MIQELFGGSNNNNPGFKSEIGDRKMLPVNGSTGPILQPPSSSTAAAAVSNSTTNSKNPTNNSINNNQMNCPRCDSANTKFCYYNNYNLTQPRYFCKTCRRYWTKGGALRNVPIGGGCRRNKPAHLTAATKSKPASAGEITMISPPPQTPILWGSPHTSHLFPLLRSSSAAANNIPLYYYQNPNPNPSPVLESLGRSVGLDPVVPSLLCSSLSSSSNYAQLNGFTLGDHHQQQSSGGVKELYQRLGFYPGNSYDSHGQSVSTTALASSSSPSSSVLESAPVNNGGAELGFWNNSSTFSWSDLQPSTTTYP